MSELAIPAARGIFGLAGVVLSSRLVRKAGIQKQKTEAATELANSLAELQRLARSSYRRYSAPVPIWAGAMRQMLTVDARFCHRLPSRWKHIAQSTRIAFGEATGALALADFSSDEEMSFIDFDRRWMGYADEYTEMVVSRLRRFADQPTWRAGRRLRPDTYDEWLTRHGHTSFGFPH